MEEKSKTDLRDIDPFDEDGIVRPEKLALVHMTKYMPHKVGDHHEIQSTAEATDYRYLRNHIHFTIEHRVSNVMGGNWDDANIMVVASLKDTIDANDKPLGISAQDTYFETSPGRNLQLSPSTHFFVPSDDPKKLHGELSYTEGDITYYKLSGYTDEEKEDIFWEINYPDPDNPGRREALTLHDDLEGRLKEVSFEQAKTFPDTFWVTEFQRILLRQYMKKEGYITNPVRSGFEESGSECAKSVRKLGKKLGCHFCGDASQIDYWNAFDQAGIMNKVISTVTFGDFILHPEEYRIVGSRRPPTAKDCVIHIFQRKDGRDAPFDVWEGDMEPHEKEAVNDLKNATDFKPEMEQCRAERVKKWSPAFAATYDVWMKKSLERLARYYAEAKDYDFDAAWHKIQLEMERFDRGESREVGKKQKTKGMKSLRTGSLIRRKDPHEHNGL